MNEAVIRDILNGFPMPTDVRVQLEAQLLAAVAGDKEDADDLYIINQRMADLLHGVAAGLKGSPPGRLMWDWSDLPTLAATMRKQLLEWQT